MNKIEQEYYQFLNNPEKIPFTFVYNDNVYKGLSLSFFSEISREQIKVDGGIRHSIVYRFEDLDVTFISTIYPKYSAYDYTVYFSNNSTTNSGVIRCLNAINANFDCALRYIKSSALPKFMFFFLLR